MVSMENINKLPIKGSVVCNFAAQSGELPAMPIREEFDLKPSEKKDFSFKLMVGETYPEGFIKPRL